MRKPFNPWSWNRGCWCHSSNDGITCTQYLGNFNGENAQIIVPWWQSGHDWCSQVGSQPYHAASWKNSWDFNYIPSWTFSTWELCTPVRSHFENGRWHSHQRFQESPCMEKSMYAHQFTRSGWSSFERPQWHGFTDYRRWHHGSSSFSIQNQWHSQFSLHRNPYSTSWSVSERVICQRTSSTTSWNGPHFGCEDAYTVS